MYEKIIMPDCPTMRRVSQGFAVCELEDGHEGPHKDGEVYWNNMQLRFIRPLDRRDAMGTPFDYTYLGKVGYDAYGADADWKNYQGKPMPKWEELPADIRRKWTVAAKAITAALPKAGL